jgi:hypothetical protein
MADRMSSDQRVEAVKQRLRADLAISAKRSAIWASTTRR